MKENLLIVINGISMLLGVLICFIWKRKDTLYGGAKVLGMALLLWQLSVIIGLVSISGVMMGYYYPQYWYANLIGCGLFLAYCIFLKTRKLSITIL